MPAAVRAATPLYHAGDLWVEPPHGEQFRKLNGMSHQIHQFRYFHRCLSDVARPLQVSLRRLARARVRAELLCVSVGVICPADAD